MRESATARLREVDSAGSATGPRIRVLIIEDERKVAQALRLGLEREGYEVALEGTGEQAFFRATSEAFDLILLDLMLPDRDGLEVLRAIRRWPLETPVIVLTARDTVRHRVSGLDAGADYYLVKPFAFDELLARIRALHRRGGGSLGAVRLAVGSLSIDLTSRQAKRGEQTIEVTNREFELLEYLMRHEGQVVSRDALARDVWKESSRTPTLDNLIDTHIARLRRKVDADRAGQFIHTIRGVGFVIREGPP
jgi:DNA-binding response OmpR family regulator